MASYPATVPNNRFQTTAPCYRSLLLSLLSPCSLMPSTLLADIQIDRPLVFGNLACRQFRALHTVSHSFRSPYHSHSAPHFTSHSAPHDHACPIPCFCDCHHHCTHTPVNSLSATSFFPCCSLLFLSLHRLLYSISILIFFVLISVQTQSDHLRTCNGQPIAVSRSTPCQSFCTPTPRMLCTPFSVIATVIVRIHARQLFFYFSFFFLMIFELSYSSFLCIDCCPPYRF